MEPPKFFAQTKFPEASSLKRNASCAEEVMLYVPAPGSKSTVPVNCPSAYTLPAASTARSHTSVQSPGLPPTLFAQRKFPEASNLVTNTSIVPETARLYVPGPGSKSSADEKSPTV